MPKLHVAKSIIIKSSKEKIKTFLADFRNWKNWSPWLVCEPEATLHYADEGKFYSWEGNRVGAGEMKVTEEKEHRIDYDLTFLKPWKSKAKVYFTFKEVDEGVLVSWYMDSSLPFFMFWMKKATEVYIGMDYDRGLKMLKEELEEGSITSELMFTGGNTFEACNFIGVKTNTAFTKLSEVMTKDYTSLNNYIAGNNIEVIGNPFSEYQKFDVVKDKVVYVAGFPVKEKPVNLPANFMYGSMPSLKLHSVGHKGKYEHLGNAWSALMMMERNKEFKKNKKAFPMEVYLNNPNEVTEQEQLVNISMPIL